MDPRSPAGGVRQKNFQNVDRQQFLLDDLDIAGDRFRRIGWEAENIARVGDDAMPPPGEQHLAIFPDLVLPLLGAEKRFRVDVLEPDEHEGGAGARRLLDEMRNAMAEGVDLQDELDAEFLALAQLDHPIEDRFPIAVAGEEIVVGDEKAGDALRRIGCRTIACPRRRRCDGARNAPLHVDDRAEAALERTAAAGIEARILGEHELDQMARQNRRHCARQLRHVVEIVVTIGLAVPFATSRSTSAMRPSASPAKEMNAEVEGASCISGGIFGSMAKQPH